jgi:hypothetical protein
MKRLNAMEKSMVRVCFSVCSYIYICMYRISFCRKKGKIIWQGVEPFIHFILKQPNQNVCLHYKGNEKNNTSLEIGT